MRVDSAVLSPFVVAAQEIDEEYLVLGMSVEE